jgi:hypothetical protein
MIKEAFHLCRRYDQLGEAKFGDWLSWMKSNVNDNRNVPQEGKEETRRRFTHGSGF